MTTKKQGLTRDVNGIRHDLITENFYTVVYVSRIVISIIIIEITRPF